MKQITSTAIACLMLAACGQGSQADNQPDGEAVATTAPASSAASASPVAAASDAVDPAWLAGAWVAKDYYCGSGAPIRFDADGAYGTEGSSGRWTLDQGKITLTYREQEAASDEPPGPEQRVDLAVVRLGANEARLDDVLYRRCPTSTADEPWHPGETFYTE
ncbi:hypothetical protein GRI97_05420 [Altererythrobacter xixiisoli]|uniref:Lipoprotein n=1 Tax=Croceibacterium xixiisoli TaxID=1476466 RepID=A0A6I4TRB3_9SPHN|nr:hypothetical protein [Croceibacterium xixiisoli]MXO98424.1 hypothetical protein [Croceibacterium xixiisoli]